MIWAWQIENEPFLNMFGECPPFDKEFFEKEVLNEKVEKCLPEEELLFITPVIKNTNNYLFSIIEEHSNRTIFSNKIDLELIKSRPY